MVKGGEKDTHRVAKHVLHVDSLENYDESPHGTFVGCGLLKCALLEGRRNLVIYSILCLFSHASSGNE